MRGISELTEAKEPAWPDVQTWVRAAKVATEVLPVVRREGETCQYLCVRNACKIAFSNDPDFRKREVPPAR